MTSTFLSRRPGALRAPSAPSSPAKPVKVSTMITKPGAKGGGCAPCAAKRKGRANG